MCFLYQIFCENSSSIYDCRMLLITVFINKIKSFLKNQFKKHWMEKLKTILFFLIKFFPSTFFVARAGGENHPKLFSAYPFILWYWNSASSQKIRKLKQTNKINKSYEFLIYILLSLLAMSCVWQFNKPINKNITFFFFFCTFQRIIVKFEAMQMSLRYSRSPEKCRKFLIL